MEHKAGTMLSLQTIRCAKRLVGSFLLQDATGRDGTGHDATGRNKVFPI